MKLFFVICITLLLCFSRYTTVSAIQTERLGAFPTNYDLSNPSSRSWFIYSLGAGQTKKDLITVVNFTNTTLSVKIYPVDATTTKDGTFALRNQTDPLLDLGSWVKMSTSQLTLQPKETIQVPFSITIPKNATIGDHAGGIIVQEVVPPKATTNGVGITIISRMGVRIYETVQGTQYANLSIQSFQEKFVNGILTFFPTLLNTGNTILNPTGSLIVKDTFGNTIDTITLDKIGTLLPGQTTAEQIHTTTSQPIFNHYTAQLQIEYTNQRSTETHIAFFSYSWLFFLFIAIFIGILLSLIVFLIRKMRKHTTNFAQRLTAIKKHLYAKTETI